MSSISDIVLGTIIEGVIAAIALGFLYRSWAGRFLIPKREFVLPYQRGVIVQGERTIRVVEPGTCWVRPRQRVVLCDIRNRPLQMVGIEVLGSDTGVVRLSLSGEFKVVDPVVSISANANVNDAVYAAVRKAVFTAAREQGSGTIIAAPELLAYRIAELAGPDVGRLGMEISHLNVWEVTPVGFMRQQTLDVPGGLVH